VLASKYSLPRAGALQPRTWTNRCCSEQPGEPASGRHPQLERADGRLGGQLTFALRKTRPRPISGTGFAFSAGHPDTRRSGKLQDSSVRRGARAGGPRISPVCGRSPGLFGWTQQPLSCCREVGWGGGRPWQGELDSDPGQLEFAAAALTSAGRSSGYVDSKVGDDALEGGPWIWPSLPLKRSARPEHRVAFGRFFSRRDRRRVHAFTANSGCCKISRGHGRLLDGDQPAASGRPAANPHDHPPGLSSSCFAAPTQGPEPPSHRRAKTSDGTAPTARTYKPQRACCGGGGLLTINEIAAGDAQHRAEGTLDPLFQNKPSRPLALPEGYANQQVDVFPRGRAHALLDRFGRGEEQGKRATSLGLAAANAAAWAAGASIDSGRQSGGICAAHQ